MHHDYCRRPHLKEPHPMNSTALRPVGRTALRVTQFSFGIARLSGRRRRRSA